VDEKKVERIPLIGEKFPEMEVKTTQGMFTLPGDFKGKWLILFSHPADFTPVCTTEFVAFQKRYDEFKKLNTELMGLSVDQVFSHIKWLDWIKEKMDVEIQFPVIADDGSISRRLGFIHGSATNTVRAVFFIDPESTVRAILYYPAELGRNFDEILRMIKAFQVADKNKVAMPANWPNNEILGDEVIIPPAATVKEAKERMSKYDCYDWWLCHKKL
jgi:peroxiredoxin (alkyl hydroperoxide reductase subunit C)